MPAANGGGKPATPVWAILQYPQQRFHDSETVARQWRPSALCALIADIIAGDVIPFKNTATISADGTVTLPADGSRYVPKVGDVVRCDDGYEYTITDVSRWDANAFADGPLGELPAPACDWSLLDQPTLPDMEVRHYTINDGEYLFIRNLYETRRMLYTLYNAIGANDQTWRDGGPVLRKDGTQLVRIELSIPKGSNPQVFWPWKPERLTEAFNSCPPGTYQMEAWDVYKNGVFQKTEYDLKVK